MRNCLWLLHLGLRLADGATDTGFNFPANWMPRKIANKKWALLMIRPLSGKAMATVFSHCRMRTLVNYHWPSCRCFLTVTRFVRILAPQELMATGSPWGKGPTLLSMFSARWEHETWMEKGPYSYSHGVRVLTQVYRRKKLDPCHFWVLRDKPRSEFLGQRSGRKYIFAELRFCRRLQRPKRPTRVERKHVSALPQCP